MGRVYNGNSHGVTGYSKGCRCGTCCDIGRPYYRNKMRERNREKRETEAEQSAPDYDLPDLARLFEPAEWMREAACRGMDIESFFPDRYEIADFRAAKQVCQRCTVAAECLDAGLDENHGVWGGTSVKDRRRIKRERRIPA